MVLYNISFHGLLSSYDLKLETTQNDNLLFIFLINSVENDALVIPIKKELGHTTV